MAFKQQNLVLWAPVYPPSPSTPIITIPASYQVPNWWGYNGGSDTIAQVSAAGYFNNFADYTSGITGPNNNGVQFQVGDQLYCVCSDGVVDLAIASLNPIVTVGATFAIPDGSITTAKLANGAVTNAKVNAAAAIDFSKLATLASGNVLVGSAGGVATSVAVTGDVTISNAGVTAIAAGVIVNADVNAAAAIAYSKLAALPSTNILVGSAGNVATAVAMSGDVTIGNTGVTAIGASKVSFANLMGTVLQKQESAVSDASIRGMYAAPVLLIPGVPNNIIVVDSVFIEFSYGGVQYADGGAVQLQYTNTVNGAGPAVSDSIAAATINGWAASKTLLINGENDQLDPAVIAGAGIYISNATGAFTAGTDGDFILSIRYYLIDVT